MLIEPGKFYELRYSYPQGGQWLLDEAKRYDEQPNVKLVSIEDHGADKPGWLTVVFEADKAFELTPGEELGSSVIVSSVEQAKLPELTPWPGLNTVSDQDLLKLYVAIPYSWDFDSLLGHISSESPFFQLDTKNPTSSARGLIQMTAANRKTYGDDRSSFRSQIPGIVGYFKAAQKPFMAGADFKLWGFAPGVLSKQGWSDDVVLYKAGSKEARAHKAFLDASGNFTVGAVRKWWDHWSTEGYKLNGNKPRVNMAGVASHAGMWALGALAAVGAMLLLGKRR